MPTISIIIPVYNSEKYLSSCLDSILSQSFSDNEIILIDDGSTDNSSEICEKYARKNNRIKFLHKINGGVSSARNVGLNNAKGEWVYFADADDTLLPNSLNTIYDTIKRYPSEFYMFGYKKENENGETIIGKKKEFFKTVDKEFAIHEMYYPTDFLYQGYLWCKLFNRNIIEKNHIRFDENIYYNEDRLFIIQYICVLSNNICYSTYPIYKYIERENGAMKNLVGQYNKKYVTDFDAFYKMLICLKDHTFGNHIINEAKRGLISSYVKNHKMMLEHHQYDSKIHHKMKRILFKTGSVFVYLKDCTKNYLYSILIIVAPKFLDKRPHQSTQ